MEWKNRGLYPRWKAGLNSLFTAVMPGEIFRVIK
jgi:hypothetical protein